MNASPSSLDDLIAELNRGITEPAPQIMTEQQFSKDCSELDRVLEMAFKHKASDLLIIAGAPPAMRINGQLKLAPLPPLDEDDTRNLLLPALSTKQHQELTRAKSVDFSFFRENLGRFRANVHYQRGTLAGSIRLLPEIIPTLASLNLPRNLRRFIESNQGLVLLTGATGCGKSSTLAALIDIINTEKQHHIVTIEDPIEYVHTNKKSIVEQIEVGHDAPDFAGSVRSIMRQNPDVILVGEMRDTETIATVLTAAETGHLVLSTLHTNDTSQAVSRILDSFPKDNQGQIRQQISLALTAIVAQQLVPAADGSGPYPALEVLVGTHAIRSAIRKGEDHQIYSAVSTGRAEGMITMEQSLAEMVRTGRITRDTAFDHCFRPEDLKRYL